MADQPIFRREDLAKLFGNDQRMIRQFEKLTATAQAMPDVLSAIYSALIVAQNTAEDAAAASCCDAGTVPGALADDPRIADNEQRIGVLEALLHGLSQAVASIAPASALAVLDEGATITSAASSLNFTGAGVTATAAGGAVTIDIPGGASNTASRTFAFFAG